jgi:type II secretory pathway pseudopilin PulG
MRPGDRGDDRGFIMVAMLISLAVAAIWMSAALPSWRQQAIREKEAELVFRGEQYARAIYLYSTKNNGAFPQSVDQLVQQRYLRKKYLDPITGKDFLPIGGLAPGQGGRGGGAQPFASAGITGVRSTSNDESIKIYRNQSTYSQWDFDWPDASEKAGLPQMIGVGGRRGGQPGREGQGGARGARGGERGGRGGRGVEAPVELMPIRPGAPPPPPPPGRGGRGF